MSRFIAPLASLLLVASSAMAVPVAKDYNEIKASIQQIAAANPATSEIFELGTSDTGDKIIGLKIGNGPVNNLVVGTHHGNEYGATEVTRAFAADAAANPIAGQTLWVIPVLNIGGYNARDRYETAGNGQSYDPNRNYPGPCGTEGPFTLKDTQALASFLDEKQIVASATLHTFGPVVLYPWGISASGDDLKTPYDDLFIQLATASIFMSQADGYTVGNSTTALYPADGTFEDYTFWKTGAWSLLWELGDTHTPTQDQVDELVRVNVPGLRQMMVKAPTTRATDHAFHGKCDTRFATKWDRHDE